MANGGKGATLTRNATPREIVKENLRALLKNPLGLVSEVDPAWVQHARAELVRVAKFKNEVRKEREAQEKTGEKASKAAQKEFAKLEKANKLPTRAQLLANLEKAGPERFSLEATACKKLEEYVTAFANMEFMAKTQTGQDAWFSVAGLLKELGDQAQTSYNEYEDWKEQLLVTDMSQPALEWDYKHVKVFEAKYSAEREAEVAEKLIAAAEVCANAIHFETVKAYVVARLEDTDEDPDHLLNEVKGLAVTASSGVSAAGGLTPGQPGTIVSAVGAFVDSGTSIMDKIVTSAIRTRRVKKIIANPDKGLAIVEAMNEDPTIMADYLRAKFNAQLTSNFAGAKPAVAGMSLGMDAAGFGVPVGSIIMLVWDSVVTAIVKASDRIQKRRIDLAKEQLKAVQTESQIEGQSTKVWTNAAKELEKELPDVLETLLDAGPTTAQLAKNGIQWGSDIPGRKQAIEYLTKVLMDKVLKKMEIPPAALWSGDDFVKNLNRFSTFGADMKNIGYGNRAAS